uniref:Reverse transcriptase domain-containing protein n=1 Tax=Tanacetum cinerariifolium TaxID=118510 RepID=A0A6L2LJ68_TANCI|nr:reverse transcriptase domain-containing protein [Tanacetum cinerariifolium]
MSAMANITPIIATFKNASVKEKTLKETDAVPKGSILDLCEEHYEDILRIILDKARHEKRKEVQTRLDFGESCKKERHDDRNVFNRLSHRKKSVHERHSETYSPSITRSRLSKASSRDPSHSRGRSLSRNRHRIRDRLRGIEESYDDTYSSLGTVTKCRDRSRATRVWFDELPPESIDEYKGLKVAFLAYFMQEKKEPLGACESGFMHGVNNPELTKCLNEHVPNTMEEMRKATTAFIRGETAAASKKNSKDGRGSNKFTTLTRMPKTIFAAESEKFKPPPPMIEELVRAGKLSYFIKEIRQGRDQQKTGKKDASVKEKAAAIYMIRSWQRVMRQKVTQSFAHVKEITRRLLDGVPSTAHEMLKFLVNGGIVTIRSTILTPTECATIAATPKDSTKKAEARHKNFKVAIHPDFPDQDITIEGTVSTKARTELCTLLKGNLDIFVWQPSDMTGVPRSIVEHRLDIREGYSPVRQKKRGQAPEHAKAIQVEHDGSWRMCVDFTDLNKACPQDYYPLPEIDWKVESICGYLFKCFLDAYKGYHQIHMAEQDEEKTAFYTSHGVYCYTKMPFGLKNDGATYQRLVDKAFDRQIGRHLEIYVDDLVIKSHTKTELLRDIEETFRPGKLKFLIVAMDYFTKWIEAKAVATNTGSQVKKFVWDNIVCRFGLLEEIVSNNEAVIPAEIGMPTYHTTVVDVVHNDEELRLNLDLLEERRERAAILEAKDKLKMTKYYNARVRGVTFRLGDFVYRSNDASHVVNRGKLGPKWEGPYEVTEALGDGAYKLRSIDGTVLSRT